MGALDTVRSGACDTHGRSHLHNGLVAQGQGQISLVLASPCLTAYPPSTSVDQSIIQGTGEWMMGGGGAGAVLMSFRIYIPFT